MIVIVNKNDMNFGPSTTFENVKLTNIKKSSVIWEQADIVIFNDGDQSKILKNRR